LRVVIEVLSLIELTFGIYVAVCRRKAEEPSASSWHVSINFRGKVSKHLNPQTASAICYDSARLFISSRVRIIQSGRAIISRQVKNAKARAGTTVAPSASISPS
jgi:hypothetical protein